MLPLTIENKATIESIIRDYIESYVSDPTSISLEIVDISYIFNRIAEDIEGIEWTTNREPYDADESWIDIVYTTEDQEDDTLSIHMYEIQWINADNVEEIITEITEIVEKCNKKCEYLEKIINH